MKSIILTDHFGEGGAERVASLLANGLADSGNEVHVCVFIDLRNYKLDESKIKIHLLSSHKYPYIINVLYRYIKLVKTIKSIKPEIIYSFGPIMASYVLLSVLLAGRRKQTRVISSERNDPRKEPASDIKKIIRDFCYKRSDVIVCQTHLAVELLKARNINSKFVIIPNPITPNLPSWNGSNSKDIITAARLTEQKNLPLLIRAFKKIHSEYPDYFLIIYGEGPLRDELQKTIVIENLTGVVKMPGFTNDIQNIMAQSYMYVSSSDYEGISNSMLEALAIGLPCVCTDCPVGGAAMYIKHGVSGLLTAVGDENGLYEGMKRYIDDKDFLKEVSQNSVKVCKGLSVKEITGKWLDL